MKPAKTVITLKTVDSAQFREVCDSKRGFYNSIQTQQPLIRLLLLITNGYRYIVIQSCH